MPDMIHTKLFRTGGSVALRIPAGWLDPDQPVTLHRDTQSGRIYVNQGDPFDTQDFFDFLRDRPFLDDPALHELGVRDEPARKTPFDSGDA